VAHQLAQRGKPLGLGKLLLEDFYLLLETLVVERAVDCHDLFPLLLIFLSIAISRRTPRQPGCPSMAFSPFSQNSLF